jgi:hypothetical protein
VLAAGVVMADVGCVPHRFDPWHEGLHAQFFQQTGVGEGGDELFACEFAERASADPMAAAEEDHRAGADRLWRGGDVVPAGRLWPGGVEDRAADYVVLVRICECSLLAALQRENTEGFYADRNTYAGTGEFMPTPDVAIMHGIITRTATERIAHSAFQLARSRTKQLTIVHKANVLKMTTGLFRDVCKEVAHQYPDVTVNDFHVDAMTVHLVRRANKFDVIVTENMFGDILSDLAGEVAGSLGIAPSINSSDTHAMAQAAHGSAPDIAGKNIANPIAMILSSAMLLRWLSAKFGDEKVLAAAELVEKAIEANVLYGPTTKDMGGTAGTCDFADAVVSRITSLDA